MRLTIIRFEGEILFIVKMGIATNTLKGRERMSQKTIWSIKGVTITMIWKQAEICF